MNAPTSVVPLCRLPQPAPRPLRAGCSPKTMPSQGRAGWGEDGLGRACLALTGVVSLAGPHGRQHLLSLRVTGLTGTDLSLISCAFLHPSFQRLMRYSL